MPTVVWISLDVVFLIVALFSLREKFTTFLGFSTLLVVFALGYQVGVVTHHYKPRVYVPLLQHDDTTRVIPDRQGVSYVEIR